MIKNCERGERERERTPRDIIAEIERIRQAVLADSTIKPNDARWRRAVLECTALYHSLPNLHDDYYDDPPNITRS